MTENKDRKVSLPGELFSRIAERIVGSDFRSVDEYVVFVLEEVLRGDAEDESGDLSPEEDEEIRRRLTSLGY